MVERAMLAAPDKDAVVFNDRRISYAKLVRSSRRLAVALLDLGLKPRDRVVVQLPNTPEFVIAYLALNWMGAIPVMALRAHRHTEVRHFIRASGANAYLVPDVVGTFDYRSMAAEMAAEFPCLRHVIVAGEPASGQRALEPLIGPDAQEDDAAASRIQAVRPSPDDVSTMLLSGGTTSVSKLIPRTHNDYVLNARLCSEAAGFGRSTVFMAILPLGHNYNLASPGLLGTFHACGTVVIAPNTDIETIFATVERERVSVIAAAVPLISNWLNSDVPKRFDLSSLKVVQNGGARLAPELRVRLRDQFGCIPQELYGTAEGLINMTRLDDPDKLLLESSGHAGVPGQPGGQDPQARVARQAFMNRRIDAYSLRLFVSTARAGSIVRGAALEHIVPSALSRVELKRAWRDVGPLPMSSGDPVGACAAGVGYSPGRGSHH